MHFSALKKPSTFFKYLVSYILIFTVLMIFFFLILRTQLSNAYSSQQADRIQKQMEAVGAHISEELQYLSQIDRIISYNPDILNFTYNSGIQYDLDIHNELKKIDSASSLIYDIVFYSRYNDRIFSLKAVISHQDGVFLITNPTLNKTTAFDPSPYINSTSGQLIWLDNDGTNYLLYLPANSSYSKSIFFYILDTSVLQSQLRGLLSDEVPGVALMDHFGNILTGIGISDYREDPTLSLPSAGIRTLQDGSSLFLSNVLHHELYLATVVSADYLPRQVNGAFLGSFASLLCLSILGILLVYVAMLFTYRPLQRLVQSLGHEPGKNRRYLDLLSQNYSELSTQKAQLEQTLADYRNSLEQYREKESTSRNYPHRELNDLSSLLEENRFAEAGALLENLLIRFGQSDSPDYLLGCILLDSLTLINNSMSKSHISFESYSGIFTEAVHLCRNIPEAKGFDRLTELIQELLSFYEKQTISRLVHITPLRQMVQDSYCDPDFSISAIAHAYRVSDSRMSTLFKEEMGIGFTDYIWQLRLEKARQLLTDTDISVDEVSQQVGYLTPNSFRRKFKQETGLTPSQYRSRTAQSE